MARGGSIELAVARPLSVSANGSENSDDSVDAVSGDLLVRCRVLEVGESNIRVEAPMTLGCTIEVPAGVDLVAMMAIGQNRWLFRTSCLKWMPVGLGGHPEMRLAIPDRVERCQRRRDYRVETASLDLPEVQLWPLLDPASVILAERLIAADFMRELDSNGMDYSPTAALRGPCEEEVMPEVGPGFPAQLVNLGGGGVGLTVDESSVGSLGRQSLYWMQFGLPPMVMTPVCATARLVHSHMQSDRRTYAGMTFDFSSNPAHKRIVVNQIVRAIACQQKMQMARQAG